MPNYTKRASRFSPSPDGVEVFHDEGAAFDALESAYGRAIPAAARQQLIRICADYLAWRRMEVEAALDADVQKTWEDVKKAAAAFETLATGRLMPPDDAGVQVRSALKRHMKDMPICFRSRLIDAAPRKRTRTLQARPKGQLWSKRKFSGRAQRQMPQAGGAIVELSMTALADISIALLAAVRRADADITAHPDERAGFDPGDAFPSFVEKLTQWAKEWEFPTSPVQNDDSAAPFSRLLFALNKLFPAHLQNRMNSEGAAAKQIKRARRQPE